jgi:N-methylhydantoinase A
VITLDMGGTSTDVALCPGAIPASAESMLTDLPLRLPAIDIHTVGAGGGSIAEVDAGGGLHAGPRSAGAVPGPVCYGRGGTEPTVTDANLLLGRLDPLGFLGGQGTVQLDLDAARRVMAQLGDRLGLSPEAAALGVVRIANATMERALRRVSVERGYDPRQFTLLPFGGAGPLHACDLAAALDIRRILVPPIPGVLSAYGMLVANVAYDLARTVLGPAAAYQADPVPLADAYTDLARRVAGVLAQEGIPAPQIAAGLDLRYRGQSYELTVPLALPITPEAVGVTVCAFHQAHAQRYGYAMEDEPVEAVTLRVRGHGPGAQPDLPTFPLQGQDASAAQIGEHGIWFDSSAPRAAPVYARERLAAGNSFAGPALVLQYDATVVVAPGWQGRVDRFHNLWLEVDKEL